MQLTKKEQLSGRIENGTIVFRINLLRNALDNIVRSSANSSNVANPTYQQNHYENPHAGLYATSTAAASNNPNVQTPQNLSYTQEQDVTYPQTTSSNQPQVDPNGELNVSFARTEVDNALIDPNGKAN